MNFFKRLLAAIDGWQQRNRLAGFSYAVVKKYGEDEAAYQGALITYYGFLSLFPLLLVATSILELVFANNPAMRETLLTDITNYFPIVGQQLQDSVSAPSRSGLLLVLGTLFTLYGARGAADALQHALNHIWHVPHTDRPGFPGAALKSVTLILVGGFGVLAAALLSTYATSFDHAAWLKILPSIVSATILFFVFLFIFQFGTAKKVTWGSLWPGAAVAAVGVTILQAVGSAVIAHQLKSLSNLYGTFALVLGLMAWIYLQAQVLLYAAEIDTVLKLRLWPRSLQSDELIHQDRRAYRRYAKKETFHPQEKVRVQFDAKTGRSNGKK